MIRVEWLSTSNPGPYRDSAYSCCVLGDTLYVVGFDEANGFGVQRYRVEARRVRDGSLKRVWVDEKAHRFASLFTCVTLGNRIYVAGATDSFWSIIAFDEELNAVARRDFDKPRFIPYSMDTDGRVIYVAGAEIAGESYAIHVEALSPDDLTPVATYTSNPMGRGAAAYSIAYDYVTNRVVLGGFDNVDGYRRWRIEILDKDLSLIRVCRPDVAGSVTGVAIGLNNAVYAVGRNAVAKLDIDGVVQKIDRARGGSRVVSSSGSPPLGRRVAIATDNNIYIMDENLNLVDATRLPRGAEIIAVTQGRIAYDNKKLYIAATQIISDNDWAWAIAAVNPSPKRFRLF